MTDNNQRVNEQAELLPCPFCGGVPTLQKTTYGRPVMKWVRCSSCEASATAYPVAADAYKGWNHRAAIEQRASSAPAETRSHLEWWTGIETDVRKSILVFAHREPERLHALVKMAYEAGQQAVPEAPAALAHPIGQQAGESGEGADGIAADRLARANSSNFSSGCNVGVEHDHSEGGHHD